ncbi:MAG TPA: response regulator [Oxalicibacterium sp.]|nr:response regulator [Oxalicibacterium sp.]
MPAPSKPKILVVNDDPGSLIALTGLLSDWVEQNGCEMIAASSGQQALREVLKHDFAVILLDVNMPGMDGFEAAQAIHSRERSASVPIIFVTAFLADEMNRLKGYQHGAVDYLFTPIIPQILQAKVSVFVALAKKNMELHQQAEVLRDRSAALLASNRQLESEISQRKIAVQQNKAKDEFLAMLGHELRNPLSAISSAASLITTNGIGEEAVARAKLILQRQTRHLTRIVDDLLDLSRVMSGKILLARKPVDFGKLVESCLETMSAAGRTEKYTINLHTEPAWLDGDAARIEQIVTNLVDNALKYTPEGGSIDIDARVEDGLVKFMIRDNGIGIPDDLLPRVFDVFVQGEISLDRTKGGLGVGLALVKQLVELHGGKITASSAGRGEGSTFEVCFPYQEHLEPAVLAATSEYPKNTYRVLLIEDNHDAREMMSAMLLAQGHTVFQASDGAGGLVAASMHRPELILIDIGLPGIDGYQVARHLRANPETREARLIALTGYGLETDRVRALEAGFNLHLVKPIQLDELNAAIH